MLHDNYYLFVEVASLRCSQLMRGAKPKIDLRAHKYTTIACREVREDLIPWRMATDEQIAAELAGRGSEGEEIAIHEEE
jgi:DNA-directed RNA polymerase subunit K/omega